MLNGWREINLLGVPLASAGLALAVALLVYAVMVGAQRLALNRLTRLAERTDTQADNALVEVLRGTRRGLIALAAGLIGLGLIDLPERWSARVGQLWFIAVALQVALWANRFISIGLRRHAGRHATPSGTVQASAAATLLSWGLRTLLWTIVLLGMLSNLGVNITAFVASLGVGGIAVALAAQNILGDLFASLAIVMDKPFEVGDFIVLGPVSGTVENVGLKTTRIRSLGGEQVVMSNTELLKQTVSNYKRLAQRRIVFTFGVTYGTTPELLAEVPGIVQRAIAASARLRFDRAHFKGFGDSSLDFEAVYIVLDPDYGIYMDEQQRINLALMRELAARSIRFALPSRTLYMVPPAEEQGSHQDRPPGG